MCVGFVRWFFCWASWKFLFGGVTGWRLIYDSMMDRNESELGRLLEHGDRKSIQDKEKTCHLTCNTLGIKEPINAQLSGCRYRTPQR